MMINYKQIAKEKKMKRMKGPSAPVVKNNTVVTIRLNKKTIITVNDASKLEFWKEKYPEAVILN